MNVQTRRSRLELVSFPPFAQASDLFRFYAWESAGGRLVHKRSGQFVETVNECSDAPITVGTSFISTLCSGVRSVQVLCVGIGGVAFGAQKIRSICRDSE